MWLVDGSSPSRSSRLVGNFLSSLPLFRKVFLGSCTTCHRVMSIHRRFSWKSNSATVQAEWNYLIAVDIEDTDAGSGWVRFPWENAWQRWVDFPSACFTSWHQDGRRIIRVRKCCLSPNRLVWTQLPNLFGENVVFQIGVVKLWRKKRKDWMESHLNIDSWPHTLDEVLCTPFKWTPDDCWKQKLEG